MLNIENIKNMNIKTTVWLAAGWLAALAASAQPATLDDFNRERLARSRRCMWVLGAWGAANLAAGAIGAAGNSGEARAFHQMNMAWGAVNLGIALPGLLRRSPATGFDLYRSSKALHQTQQVFLFNAGLDVGYIASGFWARERAKTRSNPGRWRGFGNSIALQGAFLLVFDLSSWYAHQRLERRLQPFFQQSSIGFNGQSLEWCWRF